MLRCLPPYTVQRYRISSENILMIFLISQSYQQWGYQCKRCTQSGAEAKLKVHSLFSINVLIRVHNNLFDRAWFILLFWNVSLMVVLQKRRGQWLECLSLCFQIGGRKERRNDEEQLIPSLKSWMVSVKFVSCMSLRQHYTWLLKCLSLIDLNLTQGLSNCV